MVGYMTPRFIPNNTTFIREGDAADEGFMALLLANAARLAERLRDNARKLRLYAKLAKAMQLEIDRALVPRP